MEKYFCMNFIEISTTIISRNEIEPKCKTVANFHRSTSPVNQNESEFTRKRITHRKHLIHGNDRATRSREGETFNPPVCLSLSRKHRNPFPAFTSVDAQIERIKNKFTSCGVPVSRPIFQTRAGKTTERTRDTSRTL